MQVAGGDECTKRCNKENSKTNKTKNIEASVHIVTFLINVIVRMLVLCIGFSSRDDIFPPSNYVFMSRKWVFDSS